MKPPRPGAGESQGDLFAQTSTKAPAAGDTAVAAAQSEAATLSTPTVADAAPPAAAPAPESGAAAPPAPPAPPSSAMPVVAPDDDAVPLSVFAERAYLDYAVSVLKGRALPDVCDGQKPVQRRILYAMREAGLVPGTKPTKSARVVGDVMGKYHPHGDSSIYDAMVRLAQDFSLRYPLVDGQGNFGSRDGDGAAAMRYTEARLTAFANHVLLSEIDLGTVGFVPNYDGETTEPQVLPARLPVALLNGASGIAVGMATEIPPHNLSEVALAAIALIRQPDLDFDQLLQAIPGPDFPGGGQIISSRQDIEAAYRSGRGSIKVRGRWSREDMARGQWQIVVSELPPGTSTQRVLEEIEEISNPKVKPGKKTLSQEQAQQKQLLLSFVERVRDESGKDHPVRLVIEPRTSRIDIGEMMNALLTLTSLETSVPLNLVAIGRDGRPRQKSLRDLLTEWIEFRFETVRNRSAHRLEKVLDRIHLLDGRLIVLLNIDEVIRVIRDSDEPKPALIARFSLSERQADDILEIRLRQLARLERLRIEQERADLERERGDLETLLADAAAMRRLVIKEIQADTKQFGDARRTLIEESQRASMSTPVVDEPMTLVVSRKGWLRTRVGHGLDLAALSFKDGDGLDGAYECRSTDQAIALSTDGRAFSIAISSLPGGKGEGAPAASFVELQPGARILHVLSGGPERRVFLATTGGFGFACAIGDMTSRQRAGKQFVSLEAGDTLLPPQLFDDSPDAVVATLSAAGRLHCFPCEELRTLGAGGRGTILTATGDDDRLIAAVIAAGEGVRIFGTGRGGRPAESVLGLAKLRDAYLSKRAGRGRPIDVKMVVQGMTRVAPKVLSSGN